MYWPFLNMYSENFGFGPGGFYYQGDLFKSGEGFIIPKKKIGHNQKGTTLEPLGRNRVWDAVAVCISREASTFPLCFCWYY